jgi:hypothetical protein
MVDRDDRRRARIEAERRRRRGSGPAERHRQAVRRRNVALSAGAVLALGVAGWALFLRDGGGGGGGGKDGADPLATIGRSGSAVVADAPDVTIGSTPEAFQIVYRVEDVGKEVGYRTDVVSVRRPWESRLESRAGRPPGKKGELSTEVATFGQRRTLSYGQSPVVVQLGPVLPASDLRLDKVLGPATAAGRIEKREVRKVLGRTCQVYRAGDYLSATALTPPTAALYTDSCVDGDGLLLEEVLVSEGKPIARRIAESIDLSPELTDDLFPAGKATVDPSKGGGSMRRIVDGTTPPGPFYVADAIPEGFRSIGRYSVVPPQAENFGTDDPTREDFRRAQIADVYVRGLDVLVIEQGATLRGAPPFEVDPGNPTIDLGPFGTAEVRFSALGNQVRAQREGGRFVQATGTLLPDELAAVLRSLREVPGGELELEDD